MKNCAQLVLILSTLLMALRAWASSEATVKTEQLSQMFRAPGTYNSPNAQCPISLIISDKGGFTQLLLQSKSRDKRVVDDVTGVAYISNNRLVYTAGPIYGTPGVFIYDCVSKNIRRIVGPKKVDKAYPQGADYFELYDVENKIYFYYSPDVDQINFDNFRTKELLFEVRVNGSAFKKVSTP